MIITAPDEFNVPDLFIDVTGLLGMRAFLKCEQMNFAGSVKLKAARAMVTRAEEEGLLFPGMTLVESSSGNLGVALSLVAAARGYGFVCVTDSRCNAATIRLMTTLGAQVEVVTRPHPEHGLLGARLERVAELLRARPGHVWLNQYRNPANPGAHEMTTGPEILAAFPDVTTVFIGVGTAGTVMGCSAHLRAHAPGVRIVGIDSVGSVTFGAPAGVRHIPGLGAGVVPAQFRSAALDDHWNVPEADTVRMCRQLADRGFLFGGSTGTVLAGARAWLAEHPEARRGLCVAIAPDGGERYLDTLYDDSWVVERYGPHDDSEATAWSSTRPTAGVLLPAGR